MGYLLVTCETRRPRASIPEFARPLWTSIYRHQPSVLADEEQGFLKGSRLLPFLLALVLLAFALGSLPRSQPGGSLLLNSFWLVYLVLLVPVIALGLILVFIGYLVYSWRPLSDAIGFQMAKKKKTGKRKHARKIQMATWVVVWVLAGYVLLQKCGGVFCQASSKPDLSTQLREFVSGPGSGQPLPLLSSIVQLNNIVQSNFFIVAFLGLLGVSSVIIARAVFVYGKEVRTDILHEVDVSQAVGVTALQDAMRILQYHQDIDPRSRIINCYQRMVQAAQGLGAKVTSDQTARELETAIRMMLLIDSSAIRELTDLFEEARYSLHPITEGDADQAQHCLAAIAEQLNTPLTTLDV